MILYFLRHGLAEERQSWRGRDADRPLTPAGKKKLASLVEALANLDLGIDLILTSPYLRALQTAEIVAEGLEKKVELVQEARLSPGFDAPILEEILRERRDSKAILFVGHEPDFSQVVSALIGGGNLLFKKAGLARVDLLRQSPLEGVLVWFFPPRLLVKE